MKEGYLNIYFRKQIRPVIKDYTILTDDGELADGVYALNKKTGSYDQKVIDQWICPIAKVVDDDSCESWIELFYLCSLTGKPRTEYFKPSELLDMKKIFNLRDKGLKVMPGENSSGEYFVDYIRKIIDSPALPIHRLYNRCGWTDYKYEEFLPYSDQFDVIAFGKNKLILDDLRAKSGTLEQWVEMWSPVVAKHNSVYLALAASLASPILSVFNTQTFALMLYGCSEIGKSQTQNIALSVWGRADNKSQIKTRADDTQISMGLRSSFLHGIPLIIDETSAIRNKEAIAPMIYSLCAPTTKSAATVTHTLNGNSGNELCSVPIFSGEFKLSEDSANGGVKNRLIEIEMTQPIIADTPYTWADVAQGIDLYYGTAGREWVKKMKSREWLMSVVSLKDRFTSELKALGASGKQTEAMSVLLAVGQKMCEELFTHVTPLTASDVIRYCKSLDDIDAADSAYNFILDKIAMNPTKFDGDSNTEQWGRDNCTSVYFIQTAMQQLLSQGGFNSYTIKQMQLKGYIVYQGASSGYRKKVRMNGNMLSCYEIPLSKEN